MCPADQLNHPWQPEAVIAVQVADVDATDGGRVDVGPEDLSAAALPAVNYVSALTMAQCDAGDIPAHARAAR